MKSDRKILIAFILNICFSIFEIVGGIMSNSVAIISDAVHDFGDAISIGISYFLEKISKKNPDNRYTYGYVRYSVLGSIITNIILIVGSIFVISSAINRFINPVDINYNSMIIFAIFGVIINFIAVYFTKDGSSLNQKAVNLHMLEDVLGWVIVLIGSFIIKITGIYRIDSILSISVAVFILIHAIKGLVKVVDLFLEKIPSSLNMDDIRDNLLKIKGIDDVHHIHIWSLDGTNNIATMHVVTNLKNINKIKCSVKEELIKFGISHSTIEIENSDYDCEDVYCHIEGNNDNNNHHHHH